jgi:hypothetical protein
MYTHTGASLCTRSSLYIWRSKSIYIRSIVNSLELCATTIVASSANRSRIHAGFIILRASDVSISLSLSPFQLSSSFPNRLLYIVITSPVASLEMSFALTYCPFSTWGRSARCIITKQQGGKRRGEDIKTDEMSAGRTASLRECVLCMDRCDTRGRRALMNNGPAEIYISKKRKAVPAIDNMNDGPVYQPLGRALWSRNTGVNFLFIWNGTLNLNQNRIKWQI